MAAEDFKRKLTAIVSADVKGYSRLMGEDDEGTVRTIKVYREVISEIVQKHRGRVVDSPGDNILAEFSSVIDAVSGAVEIQEDLLSDVLGLFPDTEIAEAEGHQLGAIKTIQHGTGLGVAGAQVGDLVSGHLPRPAPKRLANFCVPG